MASVASFFISRIDTAVDALLSERLKTATDAGEQALLRSLLGKVAIANAKLTYQLYQELFRGAALAGPGRQGRADAAAACGPAPAPRIPATATCVYVEELIGPDTVNTMPPATLDAFRDHGRLRARASRRTSKPPTIPWTRWREVGISMAEVTDKLLDEGVQSVRRGLRQAARRRGADAPGGREPPKSLGRPPPCPRLSPRRCRRRSTIGAQADKVRRLWAHDATLWTGTR